MHTTSKTGAGVDAEKFRIRGKKTFYKKYETFAL